MVKIGFYIQLFCLTLLVGSCALKTEDTWQKIQLKAQEKNFKAVSIEARGFKFSGFIKNTSLINKNIELENKNTNLINKNLELENKNTNLINKNLELENKNTNLINKNLVVYIEGDGLAFKNGLPSKDPSPKNPQAYYLALEDPAPLVFYMARIGQYEKTQTGEKYQTYWSDKRLAPEVIEASNLALDKIKNEYKANKIHLIGYSGGGGIAALMAEKRSDIASLVTVAGLLDVQWWVENNKLKPLAGSLNPADYTENLKNIPQIHFYGINDKIIKPGMSENFFKKNTFKSFKRIAVKSNHWNNWTKLWPSLLTENVLEIR